jgi:hypothetical protein
VFFVQDIVIRGNDWQVVLQKEPCVECVVAKVEELLLGMDIDGEEGGLGANVGHDNNIAQLYNEEGGEEAFTIEVEGVDAKLLMH